MLDEYDGTRRRDETLLDVLVGAARWWLLFGRLLPILLRTDDARYRTPDDLGAITGTWNGREWLTADRGL